MNEKYFKIYLTLLLLGHLKMKISTEMNFKWFLWEQGLWRLRGNLPNTANNNIPYTAFSAILEDKGRQ